MLIAGLTNEQISVSEGTMAPTTNNCNPAAIDLWEFPPISDSYSLIAGYCNADHGGAHPGLSETRRDANGLEGAITEVGSYVEDNEGHDPRPNRDGDCTDDSSLIPPVDHDKVRNDS